jgi:cytochrome c-type biogenesis protein
VHVIDIVLGFFSGMLSCLTPEALLLLPLFPAAAGADDYIGIASIPIGLGLSLVCAGALAAAFGAAFGMDAIWLRRLICAALLWFGFVMMRQSTVERFPLLTGGSAQIYATRGAFSFSGAMRLILLALAVGVIWSPVVGPTLGRASLMAAGERSFGMALGILFAFGAGAAVPWVLLGRAARIPLRPAARHGFPGMAGKRIFGMTLLLVAILGLSGLDVAMAQDIRAALPGWLSRVATAF